MLSVLTLNMSAFLRYHFVVYRLVSFSFFKIFLFIDFFREREERRERETLICCSTRLCINWLIVVCALTGDGTHDLGTGQCSNQVSYLASVVESHFQMAVFTSPITKNSFSVIFIFL